MTVLTEKSLKDVLMVLLMIVVASATSHSLQDGGDSSTRLTRGINGKVRHSRHMMTRSPNSYPSDESYFKSNKGSDDLVLTVQDNHKPRFVNCSSYAPSVQEEKERGTFVFQVQAVDPDPPDHGGTLFYSFVSSPGEKLKFTIDNTTGVILTKHEFDRDEPARETEVYLTVRVTDNGNPQLVDTCQFKVTIDDINDNQPFFDKAKYLDLVPQDLQVDQEVMRISATDIDNRENSLVWYQLSAKNPEDEGIFHIDNTSGIITLKRNITRPAQDTYHLEATATDRGEPPKSTSIDIDILVVESHKKAPSFIDIQSHYVQIREDFNDYATPIVTLKAKSNIPEERELLFELVQGRTEQTNRLNTFVLSVSGEDAQIKLARALDYESVKEYFLTVRVQNKYNLAAETQITIEVLDVNDNIPYFTELVSGLVSENEPPGTPVMQVRAIDVDGTSAHNQVTYELADHEDLFAIDPYTGNITTRVTFDREAKDFYNVKVRATDNSPSALFGMSQQHNRGEQVFRIEIADKNDNPPRFTQKIYRATGIREDANLYSMVAEVKALDNDTSSPVTYSIVAGNTNDAFYIEPKTGKIKINNKLDYEQITRYNLKIKAFDGIYQDSATVEIEVENVNDNPPIFYDYISNITILEETLEEACITTITAYDPDIADRSAPQHIAYFIVDEKQREKMSINASGCLFLKKPLDRDPPHGYPIWQVTVAAVDEDGIAKTSLKSLTEVIITLIDINDNAPYLDMVQPVYWTENKPPGVVTRLHARDLDSEKNGPPFTFRVSTQANTQIQKSFSVDGNSLHVHQTLDREEQKVYMIPIVITDSGTPIQTGTSTLTLVVGDENDNAMKPGKSEIFVYNYMGKAPDTQIGRVYVEDPDDWDLPSKTFTFKSQRHPNFDLDQDLGIITMNSGTPNGSYLLEFVVTEESSYINRHSVDAVVNVTVKDIPEEAVKKSASIRFSGLSPEDFIAPNENGFGKRNILHRRLAKIFNVSLDNVDVFTVLKSPHHQNESLLDVRFSAHGSPYYEPSRLNYAAEQFYDHLEKELGVEIQMISIDECLIERAACERSCRNVLNISQTPYTVFTNTSSFVGIQAIVDPICTCVASEPLSCLNGGTPLVDRCVCPDGFQGPRCELSSIGFSGDGWALYPRLDACEESHLSFDLRADKADGLVFYMGPTRKTATLGVKDFMALELKGGYPSILVDYGSGTVKLNHTETKLNNGAFHRIDIKWNNNSIELEVDNCRKSSCLRLTAPRGKNQYLNVNGPLQIGGSFVDLMGIAEAQGWEFKPQNIGFAGCISNFTFNQKMYNLGQPEFSKNADFGCNVGLATAYSFGIDTNFLVAILVCIAILLVLLLGVVVHRRKTDDLFKDADDIRENIINYEDEGGGEGDMTGYDLNVLRLHASELPLTELSRGKHMYSPGYADAPDINGFLEGRKSTVDNDPDSCPFDDVRNYAYEGDGNSMGSLSSLASGTDEEDLDFDYLSNFGPRFRKLADMYGEPSDGESENYPSANAAASESWC